MNIDLNKLKKILAESIQQCIKSMPKWILFQENKVSLLFEKSMIDTNRKKDQKLNYLNKWKKAFDKIHCLFIMEILNKRGIEVNFFSVTIFQRLYMENL